MCIQRDRCHRCTVFTMVAIPVRATVIAIVSDAVVASPVDIAVVMAIYVNVTPPSP